MVSIEEETNFMMNIKRIFGKGTIVYNIKVIEERKILEARINGGTVRLHITKQGLIPFYYNSSNGDFIER